MTYYDWHMRGAAHDWLMHSWRLDLRQRLTFLYADPDKRLEVNQPDVAAWRRLGEKT